MRRAGGNGICLGKILRHGYETGADEMFRFRGLTGKIYSNDTNEKEINSEDWENTNDLPFN